MRRWLLLGLLLLPVQDLWADVFEEPTSNAPALPPEDKDKTKDTGSSWVPVVGYNPTYKVFLGGGYFYHNPTWDFGIHGVITFESVYQIMTHSEHILGPRWKYRTELEYSKGFEPYYGEGGDTKISDRIRIFGDKTLVKPLLTFAADPFWDLGFFLDLRFRGEDHVLDGPNFRRFPNESTMGIGILSSLDKRDDANNPTSGFILDAKLTVIPGSLTTVQNTPTFAQLEGDIAFYQETVMSIVAAVKLYVGTSIGTPTYLFKYRLGGTDNLRGYQDNRFRGKEYYLQQTELRMPFFKWLDVVPFLGFGDATDSQFTQAKMAYGAGLRIGLPPDYINRIRIDYGVGRDESGIFVDFGQTF